MRILNKITIGFLRIYKRVISPLLPPSCRFNPSCSLYAIEAFRRYPFHKGLWKTVGRLSRCHPLHPGGYDPLV